LKTCDASEVTLAVHACVEKRTLSKAIPRHTIDLLRWERKKLDNVDVRLTQRQREVLQLLAEGKVIKEISVILHMSLRTANYHKYQIRKRLGANSDAELVRYAVRNQIVAA
jgi:DNA-binding CsgD family transcriptional regulator